MGDQASFKSRMSAYRTLTFRADKILKIPIARAAVRETPVCFEKGCGAGGLGKLAEKMGRLG
jgi:hypothetical protein